MSVTIRDVAKLAGVSVTSVSATLSGTRNRTIRVSEVTRERIYAAAAQLGYSPSHIAKSLATGKTQVVGLVLPYAEAFVDENPFSREIMSGVLHEVISRQYNIMLFTATEGKTYDEIARLVDSRVGGLVLVMPPDQNAVLEKCVRRRIPAVSILRHPDGVTPTVNADDFACGVLAAEHLYALGHRRVAVLTGSPDVVTTGPRRDGFLSVFAANGISAEVWESEFNMDAGERAVRDRVAADPHGFPTGLFCANDLCAAGAMRAATALGWRVPEDISIVGCDGTSFSARTQPALTTTHIPISQMGARAAAMLIDLMEDRTLAEPDPTVSVSLCVRESTAPPRTPTPHSLQLSH